MRQDTIKILADKLIKSADLQYSSDQSLTLAIHDKAVVSHESPKVKWTFKPIAEKKSAKWLTREKRGAYYLYADFTCAFCLNRYQYTELTIDHVVTRETTEQTLQFLKVTSSPTLRAKASQIKKSKHATGNLVTCCNSCNMERKTMDFEQWLFKVVENWLRKGTVKGKISKASIARAKRTLSMVRDQLQLRDNELRQYKEMYKCAFLAFENKKGQYKTINGTKYSVQRDSAFAALFGKEPAKAAKPAKPAKKADPHAKVPSVPSVIEKYKKDRFMWGKNSNDFACMASSDHELKFPSDYRNMTRQYKNWTKKDFLYVYNELESHYYGGE